jgi:hypothetical protein
MSEEIAQLRSFSNYVVRNDLMNSMNNGIVERSTQYLNSLREQVKALAKQSHYEAFKENFQAQQPMDIPEDVVEQFTDQFTVKNFKEDIKSVFPVLYRLMQEENTIGYDDIVAMTAAGTESIDTEVVEGTDEFDKFESWVMGLGESSAIASQDPEEQAQAVKQLQELVGQHFSAGVDGSNAIESLKGIIDDPKLFQAIKNQSKEDPDSCTRGLVKDWLEVNAPEVVDQLDFGDFVEEPKEDQGAKKSDIPAYMRKAKGGDDWKVSQQDLEKEKECNISSKEWLRKQNNESLNIQELAEFVQSFYDKDSGTFPKGPEGVAIMVGKKYGEQAEMVARKFVERMAPGQQVPENIDIGDGIVVGGKVVSIEYPDMTGKVVMIDPKMAQRVHVQWDRGGRAEPMQRSKLKAVAAEDIELARIRELSGM